MKHLRPHLVTLLLLLSAALNAQPLQIAHVFSDHAVLQQDTSVPVWGWGEPGKKVQVKASWLKKAVSTTVADDGSWRVQLQTLPADGCTKSLLVKSGKEKIELKDVVFGEVWICSGQSNMEMPVSGFGFQGIEGSTEAILEAAETASQIRVFDIKTPKCKEPQKDVDAVWAYSTGDVVSRTSAVGYFFAKRLSKALGVPVGIIVNAWGGSRIEPWMTREAIDRVDLTPEERAEISAIVEQPDRWPESPELIWNGRVKPIAGYAAKGFLWYQGCSNIGQRGCYDRLQASMLQLWRDSWGRGDMPFIYALLAPYHHGDSDGRWRPFFVEAQMRMASETTNAWYVCTETLGDPVTIHPPYKREVADMMELTALQNVYGIPTGISIEPALLKDLALEEDGTVKVWLTNVWSNLGSMTSRDVVGFELAGEDREFHLAKAEVDWDGQTIIVKCPDVPKPVAVRYAWRNWMGANLQKTSGIPVPPFRTDDWDY